MSEAEPFKVEVSWENRRCIIFRESSRLASTLYDTMFPPFWYLVNDAPMLHHQPQSWSSAQCVGIIR